MGIVRAETAAFKRWAEDHLNYCRHCEGSGIAFEDVYIGYTEGCSFCQGFGKCPQCGWTTYNDRREDFTDECAMCGWEWNDWLTMPPPRYEWITMEDGLPSVYLLNADLYEIPADEIPAA